MTIGAYFAMKQCKRACKGTVFASGFRQEMSSNTRVDLKVILLGHKAVGKTSMFNRYVYDEFGKTAMTIGAYFAMKQCKIGGNKVYNLAIWDTAGEEKFDSLTNFYCRNARAALVCYDITNRASFTGIQKWVDKVKQEADPNCAMLIVGNKLDLVEGRSKSELVELSEVQKYAEPLGAKVIEVSAKTGHNISKIFEQVVETALQRGGTSKMNAGGSFPESKKGGCCS
eukprot:CAMPEP_0170198520 /NCGR_PEP_ID=MMETSP0040_2-20121228/68819_1 /TAXON_ID=641309 /ORGANISM="Lotharella oceanica, Strain CCMP622" /LENGTH=226 /DNA_ID=CAMNT_0010448521 /DNA_START=316 /DNA_END=996 /DNA_ORIENTATION=-